MFTNFFKTACRNILRQKTFSFINIAGLALSLTAVWLIALFVVDELSYDQYHTKADRIFRLASHGQWGNEKFDVTGTSGRLAEVLKSDFPEVEEVARIDAEGGGMIRYGDKNLKEGAMFFTDASFFKMFTYKFLAGDISALSKPNSVVLTRSVAAKLFTDPVSAFNKTIYLDNIPTVITGVIEDVPQNSHITFNALRSMPQNYEDDWASLSIYTYVLLKKYADPDQLRSKLPAFITKYLKEILGVHYQLELQPLTAIHLHSHLSYELGENRDVKYMYVLSIVGLLIVLVAFINYINITTARASVRLREVAVRKIIGSSRSNLMELFLTEAIITILSASCISLILMNLVMPLYNQLTDKHLTVLQFGAARTILYMLAFSFAAGLIGGCYPAMFLSRFKTIPALKNQLGDVKGQTVFRKLLVTFQFIVTVVMITASLVIYLQLNYVFTADLGFNKGGLMTFHLDSRELRQKVPALREALLESPLVKAVASAGNPIGNNDIGMMDYQVEKNGALDQRSNLAYGLTIDADFIPAMQLKLLEGRNFATNIPTDSNGVIVNEAFVKRQGWASGMGKRISRGKDSTGKVYFSNIIGVVKDYHIYSLQHKIEPMIMSLPAQAKERDNMYVRLDEQNLSNAIKFVEQTFRKFDAVSPFDYRFLDQNFAARYKPEEKQGQVLLAFTVLTICIACLGLFGLITFTVGKRVKEIGIRKVLGASAGSMVTLLTESLLKVVLVSMLVAVPISWLIMSKWLEDFAYRIQLEWWMFGLAGIMSIVVAMATLSVQAIKAAMANPIKSLRTE
ncbi:MAG TPA: ABC transporter permease [Segetibacter sp.]|nr:ABC transporter permease [Segetibacter sp.]